MRKKWKNGKDKQCVETLFVKKLSWSWINLDFYLWENYGLFSVLELTLWSDLFTGYFNFIYFMCFQIFFMAVGWTESGTFGILFWQIYLNFFRTALDFFVKIFFGFLIVIKKFPKSFTQKRSLLQKHQMKIEKSNKNWPKIFFNNFSSLHQSSQKEVS